MAAQLLLNAAASSLQARLKTHALDYASGVISHDEITYRALQSFLESHTNAAFIGRSAAGITHPIDSIDRGLAELVAPNQSHYFENFLRDIAAGKYHDDDGVLNEAAIEARSGLYTLRLRGTANDSWTLAQPDELINWNLGGTENNCSVCPSLAEDGPYPGNDMPTTPGSNETPCLFNCECYLTNASGAEAFKSFTPELKGYETLIDPFHGLRKSGSPHSPFCSCSKNL